MDKIKKR